MAKPACTESGEELEGRIIIIVRDLYSLNNIMTIFHKALSDKPNIIVFRPSKTGLELWII